MEHGTKQRCFCYVFYVMCYVTLPPAFSTAALAAFEMLQFSKIIFLVMAPSPNILTFGTFPFTVRIIPFATKYPGFTESPSLQCFWSTSKFTTTKLSCNTKLRYPFNLGYLFINSRITGTIFLPDLEDCPLIPLPE